MVVSLLMVLAGVGVYYNNKYVKGFNKKALQEAGEQFAIAMKNCINSSKWKVTDLAGSETYPCYPDPAPSTTKDWKKKS